MSILISSLLTNQQEERKQETMAGSSLLSAVRPEYLVFIVSMTFCIYLYLQGPGMHDAAAKGDLTRMKEFLDKGVQRYVYICIYREKPYSFVA